jgi:hypothetical protein
MMIHLEPAEHDPPILGARLLWLLALVAVTLGLAQAQAASGRFPLGKAEVRYSRGGTRADARAIVDMLVSIGVVRPSDEDNDWAWQLEVTREAGRRVVHLTPPPPPPPGDTAAESRFAYLDWRERSCLDAMHILSREAFSDSPVDVRCHDPSGGHEVAVRWEQRRCRLSLDLDDFAGVEYELGGQESEARSIAQSIHQLAIFEPRGWNRLVVKRSGATHVVQLTADVTLMAAERSDALARELRAQLHPLAGAWSQTVFGGEPVDIWLVYQSSNHLEIDGYDVLSWATRPR